MLLLVTKSSNEKGMCALYESESTFPCVDVSGNLVVVDL